MKEVLSNMPNKTYIENNIHSIEIEAMGADIIVKEENSDLLPVREIAELSGKYHKVFIMNDGSSRAVFYVNPIKNSSLAAPHNDSNAPIAIYSWIDGQMSMPIGTQKVGAFMSGTVTRSVYRMYIKLSIPFVQCNPKIKKAELKLHQQKSDLYCLTDCPKLVLYQVAEDIHEGTYIPVHYTNIIDSKYMKRTVNGNIESYAFDITELIANIGNDENSYINLVIMSSNEKSHGLDNVDLYCNHSNAEYAPEMCVTYECPANTTII